MNELKSFDIWIKFSKWLWSHGFVALLVIGIYFWASANGILAPSVRFATAQEVSAIREQISEQKKNYEKINRSLVEIRIGQKQVLLRDMQREVEVRMAAGQAIPNWLDEQLQETRKQLERLKKEVAQ